MKIGMADPLRREQLTAMLMDKPWAQVAQFAAFNCQMDSMNLPPWQEAPCHGYLVDRGKVTRHPQAGRWADRLIGANLSVWEPCPVEALARAERPPRKAKR